MKGKGQRQYPICWRCRELGQGPICVSCDAIQPPSANPDYFAVLDLPRRYDVSGLDEAHRRLTRLVHPDRYTKKSAVERRMALQWMATANEAKRVLKDPLIRARYLATGLTSPREDKNFPLPPEFLEMIFEFQMEKDDDPHGVEAKASQLHASLQEELNAVLLQWESKEGDLSAVEGILAKLKYTTNLIQGH